MKAATRRAAAFIFMLAAATAACSGSSKPGGAEDTHGPWTFDIPTPPDDTVGGGDTAVADVEPSDNAPFDKPDGTEPPDEVGQLLFVQPMGDDRVACDATVRPHCTIIYQSFGERELEVLYTVNGEPRSGKTVQFEIIGAGEAPAPSAEQASLEALSTYTTGDGIGRMELTIHDATEPFQFAVKVWVPSDRDAGTLYFDVLLDPKGQPPLTVVFEYNGRQRVEEVQVKLFRQDGAPRSVACADLDLDHLPTADVIAPTTGLQQSAVFPNDAFPNLETDTPQRYTILAFGSRDDVARISGCNDVDGEVRWNYGKTVILPLTDVPPRLVGVYEVKSEFDLVSALPDNVEVVVNTILGFFDNPAGQLVLLICQLGGQSGALNDLCGYVFTDPENPDINDLTMIGDVIVQILNALLQGILEDNGLGDILFVGRDIGDILKHLTFTSLIEFEEEPDPLTGLMPAAACHDDWQCVQYRWTYNVPNCPNPQQPDCGMNQFCFAAIGMNVVTADFSAGVNVTESPTGLPPYSLLTVDPHGLNIKYGMLMNYLIQKELLPLIAGDGSDGGPVIDSYEKFIKSLIAGKECLFLDTCCADFAASVLDQTGDVVSETLIIGACEALVEYGSAYLENLLLGLDANTENTFVIGTPSGDPCRIYDDNDDLVIDTLGKQTEPCRWDALIRLFNSDVHVDATFVGIRD